MVESCYDPTGRVLGKERLSTPPGHQPGGGDDERILLTRNIFSVQGRKIAVKSAQEIISIKSKAINRII